MSWQSPPFSLFARRARLPEGWAESVTVRVDTSGKISSVEPNSSPDGGTEVQDLGTHILLPAPSNLHSHSFQRAMAGLSEQRGDGQDSFWTWRELMYRFVNRLTPEQVEAIAALAFLEMLESGFAAVAEFHYLHHSPNGQPYDNPAELGERIIAAAKLTGIGLTQLPTLYQQADISGSGLAPHQARFRNDLPSYLHLLENTERALRRELPPDCQLGNCLHSLRAVPIEAVREVGSTHSGRPTHVHIAEQLREVEEVVAATGARPVEYLLDQVALDEHWCLVHATHLVESEVRAIANTGAVVGLCPITEANLGDGLFPMREFIDRGGRFGVGSDSNIRISLSEELRILEYGQRLKHHSRNVCVPGPGSVGGYLFDAALSGGAQALGRASGSIRVGQWADLVALDPEASLLETHQDDALIDGWLFSAGDAAVSDVWSAGRHLIQEGRHPEGDRIRARYRKTLAELQG